MKKYEEKAMTDVNPGSYFPFSTNPQKVKEELWPDASQLNRLTNFMLILTLQPTVYKSAATSVTSPNTPSVVSQLETSSIVCLRLIPQDQKQDAMAISSLY